MFKFFQNKNILSVVILLITLLFFGSVLFFVWEYASPYCKADDWRQIRNFLRPCFEDKLSFFQLWQDPHPAPLYVVNLLVNAKFFNLQIHYNAIFYIFFQLFMFIVIIKSILTKDILLLYQILGIAILSTIVFNFSYSNVYIWDRIIHGYFYLFCYVITIFIFERRRDEKNSPFIVLSLPLFILMLLYSELTTIMIATFITFFTIRLLVSYNKRILRYAIVIFLEFIVSKLILVLLVPNYNVTSKINIEESLMLIKSPCLMLETFGITLTSGIINYKSFTLFNDLNNNNYKLFGLIFGILYIFILFKYFQKKYYQKSMIPGVLMIFTIIYIGIIALVRSNPITQGEYCLIIPRYAPYYQFGLAGFIIVTIQLLNDWGKEKLSKFILIAMFLTSLSLWIPQKNKSFDTGRFMKSRYPEISEKLRERANTPTVELPLWVIPERLDSLVNSEIKFLKEKELNMFAPNYPYSKRQKNESKDN